MSRSFSTIRQVRTPAFILALLLLSAGLIGMTSARGDGCFVLPFKWNKQKDINEPTQKAIIVREGRREDLILQVKYEGPANTFGWLIPVPELPKVEQASMDCFYELSRYTQEYMEPRRRAGFSGGAVYGGSVVEPVKVIEVKTVGAYRVTVLFPRDAGGLEKWLHKNDFVFPQKHTKVLESYLKQRWYFVAVRIDFAAGTGPAAAAASKEAAIHRQLASGELHPLRITFETEQCVFPLKISSVLEKSSEVQIYLLSAEPLIEKGVFEKKLRELHQWNVEREEALARDHPRVALLEKQLRLDGDYDPPVSPLGDESIEERRFRYGSDGYAAYATVSQVELPLCGKQLPGFAGKTWWLSKQTWIFKPEEMRDLVYQSAIPVLSQKLADEEGYFAALNLAYLGSNAVPAFLQALRSPDAAVRIRAALRAEWMQDEQLFRALAECVNDAEPVVRKLAILAAGRFWDDSKPALFLKLLRDRDERVRFAAAGTLSQHGEAVSNCFPALLQLLEEKDPSLQASTCRALSGMGLRPPVSKEALRRLLKAPRLDVYNTAYEWLWREHFDCSCDDAEPLLQNPSMAARLLGLRIIECAGSARAVELALPLLRDRERRVRYMARDVLSMLTEQEFSAETPDHWESWWKGHNSDLPQPKERDLIDCVREVGAYSGHFLHVFPYPIYPGHELTRLTELRQKPQPRRTPIEQRDCESYRRYARLARFLHQETVVGSFRYLGTGVPYGDATHVICYYRPNGSKPYRAVYGNLEVKDVPLDSLPPLEGPPGRRLLFQQ